MTRKGRDAPLRGVSVHPQPSCTGHLPPGAAVGCPGPAWERGISIPRWAQTDISEAGGLAGSDGLSMDVSTETKMALSHGEVSF